MNDSPTLHSSRPAGRFSVAGWIVDAPSHHISKAGKTTRLEPRIMAVLSYLADRPGETVSRDEFEREVWPGQVVVYEALSNSIAKLRKALGDDAKHHHIIETIPKVGYRLIGEVIRLEPGDSSPEYNASLSPGRKRPVRLLRRVATAILAIAIMGTIFFWPQLQQALQRPNTLYSESIAADYKTSIAVLPFTNMSGDPEQDYFADGLTDDLITDLSKVSGLFVIARNSTFKYKGMSIDLAQVSRELGVDYLLEGSVRRVGDRVRINAQLIDATSGGHLWAERYDSSLADIFTLQVKIAQQVASALAIELTPEDRAAQARSDTVNPEAYEAFLQAWAHYRLYTPAHFVDAIPYLETSIRLDPRYARAHGLLATIYYHTFSNGWQGGLGTSIDGTIENLERHLNEALKNPTSLTHQTASRYYASLGRHDEALAHAERSIAVDPNDGSAYIALARILNRHDEPAEGLAAVRMAARLDPGGNLRGSYSYRIGESNFHMKNFERAAEEFNKAHELNPSDEWSFLYLAATYGYLGRKKAATSAMEEFEIRRSAKGRRPYTLADLDGWHFPNPDVRERFRDGLRKVGIPPGASRSRKYPIDKPPAEIEGAETVGATKAKALFDRGVPFVDVRKDPDWNSERIPGAVQLLLYADFSEFNLSRIGAKDDEVVVYAYGLHSGYSTTAIMRAITWGYEKIYFFRGGFPAWKAAGLPVDTLSK
jgi:adenylate cyclase